MLVGTRSHVIRLSTSDGHMRCTASDGRGTPARPASHVLNAYVDVLHRTRRNAYTIRGVAPELPSDVPAEVHAGARPASHVLNAYVDVLHRTRRNAYTIRGVAPELPSDVPAEVHAGARPYQIRSPRLNRPNFFQKLSSLC